MPLIKRGTIRALSRVSGLRSRNALSRMRYQRPEVHERDLLSRFGLSPLNSLYATPDISLDCIARGTRGVYAVKFGFAEEVNFFTLARVGYSIRRGP